MKIRLSFEIDDDTRRALNARVGLKGKAKRADVVAWAESEIETMLNDVLVDYGEKGEEEAQGD